MKPALFIGLMSGTSTDGVDGVLADFTIADQPRMLANASLSMPETLRKTFLELNTSGHDELAKSALAALELTSLYAQVCHQLLASAAVKPSQVAAIGAHGQTVRHNPQAGYSIQLNAPAQLAELTGIDVIADFRSRDIAAAGQGAPLVPVFHQALFQCEHPRAILNLGGMGNLTLLEPGQTTRGFDTGPANVLLDLWCQDKTGAMFDKDGLWAATGRSNPQLLSALYDAEPWFALPPPKSTGRDLFNRAWLDERLAAYGTDGLADEDVQATLQSLTVLSIKSALHAYAPDMHEVLVCGGGALNSNLMRELAQQLKVPVRPTSELGVAPQNVEALAFAWLAHAHIKGIAASLPSVTGARAPRILGARYPA